MLIKLTDVSMHYAMAESSVTVLDHLDMAVDSGERVAIVGPSGSGKSTLLLLLTGLEKPSAGQIVISGQSLDTLSADERADLRRTQIGIVFQSFHLIPTLSAWENVALPLDISGLADSRGRAAQMLDAVGLSSRLDHYPAQLSGGEQQRVAIARALVHQPRLLVADEPTGNLDDATGASIMPLLLTLNRELGTTLILVTHDQNLAVRCDRTLQLHDGRLQQIAQPQQTAQPRTF